MAVKLGEFVAFILGVIPFLPQFVQLSPWQVPPVTVGDINLWCIRNTSNEGRLGAGLFSDIEEVSLAEFNQVQL